jgi:uncharacterized membrane protein
LVWKFDLWARPDLLGFTPDGARGGVAAITSSFLTFIVFLLTMLFIAVQIAEAQLTPHIIANVFRRLTEKLSLGFFVFTYVFSVSVQGRIGNPVPHLAVFLTAIFSVVSIGVFLFLVGYIGKSLRPISVYTRVAAEGGQAIKALSPAFNDPTTAVRGIDQIHRLLHIVGTRDLGNGRVRDRTGQLRLIFPTGNWGDFVWLGASEIRL